MAQDTWQYQGRQYHQWFGHGTAPKSFGTEPSEDPSAGTIAQRVHQVGHTLIAGLPASKRHHDAAKLGQEDHARLDRLLTATVQALPAGGPAVARHVFGVEPDTPGIDGFVRAGRLLRDGRGSADTRAATDAVGRAAQDIGLDHFKSFLRAADDRLQARGGLLTLARYLPNPSGPSTDVPARIPGLPVPGRLPWGPLIVGLAAQALPMIAELSRREDVRDTIKSFGLDPSKPADVTAAYAHLWAEDHGPWLFDTPQTGPAMQEMAERVMRAAQADPPLSGRAVAGDDDAQKEFSAAVAPPAPGSGIETRSNEERALVARRLSEGRTAIDIQAELNARRAGGKGSTAVTFQTSHYNSRLYKGGLDVDRVENLIRNQVSQVALKVPPGVFQSGRITIDSAVVEYRYFKLSDGSIVVGTIFVIK